MILTIVMVINLLPAQALGEMVFTEKQNISVSNESLSTDTTVTLPTGDEKAYIVGEIEERRTEHSKDFDVVSLVVSVVEVAKNPDDPMAWLGVAADVASLVVPCVSGGGAIVRAATKADDFADAIKTVDRVDDTFDAAKTGWHVGDDITNLTKAGDRPSWSTVRQRYWKNEAYYHPELYPDDLDRLKKGLAPIGEDGFSMELHHPKGRSGDNFFIFEPMTRTQHRSIHYGG